MGNFDDQLRGLSASAITASRATRSGTAMPATTPSATTAPTSSASARPNPPRSTSPSPRSTTSTAGSGSGRPGSAARTCHKPPPGTDRGGDPPAAASRRTRRPARHRRWRPRPGRRHHAAVHSATDRRARRPDRDDVAISARKGVVTVRRGKGERYRQVPLNAEARDTLDAWLDKRNALPGRAGPGAVPVPEGTATVRPRDRPRRTPPREGSRRRDLGAHPAPHLPDPARAGGQRHRPRRRARRTLPARDHPPLQPAQRRRTTGR